MQSELNPSLIAAATTVRVIPVLTIVDAGQAVPLARALVAGGLSMLEITLRTAHGLDAIRRIAAEVDGAMVGAGTVLTPEHGEGAIEVGARFLVSPGSPTRLLDAAEAFPVPMLPGVATASEAMEALDRGYRMLKYFPAEPSGGIPALKALAAPLPELKFCPTGGVGPDTLQAYLACPNVVCVGGSWVAPQKLVDAGAWGEITRLARAASSAT